MHFWKGVVFVGSVFGVVGAFGIVLLVIKSMVSDRSRVKAEHAHLESTWKSQRKPVRRTRHESDDDDYDDDYELRERERRLSSELRSIRRQMNSGGRNVNY